MHARILFHNDKGRMIMKKTILLVGILGSLCVANVISAQTRSTAFDDGQFGKWIITSSSTLAPQSGKSYAPKNAVDGDDATAWVEGAPGHGVGESIMITFEQPMKIGTIWIKNGYGKSRKLFQLNGRVKKANVQMDGGMFPIVLKDTMKEQTITVPKKIRDAQTTWVKLTIESVYPGSKWSDVAVNEFRPNLEEFNYDIQK